MTIAFISGCVLATIGCALLAGFIWVSMTPGNDHPLTNDEIKERIGQVWG